MATQMDQSTETQAVAEFDTNAQKGWQFFTKFLVANVVVTVAALVFVALLTVWS